MRRFALLIFLLALVPALAAFCPAERAQYAASDSSGFTAGFMAKPPGGQFISDLAFYLHSSATKRTFWFLFDAGSARYMNLISASDVRRKGWAPPDPDGRSNRPYFDTHYLQADSGLVFRPQAPHRGEPAPVYILLPDLAQAMWYSLEPREGAPIGVYKLIGCK